MRLWAALDTITFGEYASRVGEIVEPSFSVTPSYVGRFRERKRPAYPIDLAALGDVAVVQVPDLGRAFTALTGVLERGDDAVGRELWLVRSALTVRLGTPRTRTLNGLRESAERGERPPCQALGQLWVVGSELSTSGDVPQRARVLRFESLCLRAGDPRFGRWSEVERYSDLGSDPDVIAAPVLLAELELMP